MTKFKVGDRVTLSGVVTRIDEEDEVLPYFVDFDRGKSCHVGFWLSSEHLSPDTTFRDQAAIAALQAALAEPCSNEHSLQGIAEYAFDLAEALDAERKERDGGN